MLNYKTLSITRTGITRSKSYKPISLSYKVKNTYNGSTTLASHHHHHHYHNNINILHRSLRTTNITLDTSNNTFNPLDTFVRRHIGTLDDTDKMLEVVGCNDLNELTSKVVPENIRFSAPMKLTGDEQEYERGEMETLEELKQTFKDNKPLPTFIGQGYYNTHVPSVILRNVLENPGWYTPYTPYQAEIAQGRLEMLLNYQTMITDLTGMDASNASLLDEATAAAEAMAMCFATSKKKRKIFVVSSDCNPQTIDVVKTRAEPLGIDVVITDPSTYDFSNNKASGVLVQYPATDGLVKDYSSLTKAAHDNGTLVVCGTDLLALTMLKPPGEFGADIAYGSAQRFGVPMGYGGPHAAFLATRNDYIRSMPGRIIGVSKDVEGKTALRMALQTREQHIRRARATSNICTAQALLANMAACYGIYHGPKGLKNIANTVHKKTEILASGLMDLGFDVGSHAFFDTVRIKVKDASILVEKVRDEGANVRLIDDNTIGISLDETTNIQHLELLLKAFGASEQQVISAIQSSNNIKRGGGVEKTSLERTTDFLTHPVFNKYHSEHEMLRYLHRLEAKDLGLNTSMIPLGSCTMKLNATTEMIPITWKEVSNPHPFIPIDQVPGYQTMMKNLELQLAEITGFHSVSLQPNAGAQGEYAGLLAIRKYHKVNGNESRNVCLIPASAHGTNPASAIMAGMKVVEVKCDKKGNIDVEHLKILAKKHSNEVSALMVTYPSTHGVFEETIVDICDIIHGIGGQVYMDGANMNAQVGLTSPGFIGADVCHLNLHKTFCIPHGGGGPGIGAIGVADHLSKHLPGHCVVSGVGGEDPSGTVSAAPWGSSAILPISHMYIKLMGAKGLTKATQHAILAANYMKERLSSYYDVLYTAKNGSVAHEFILDMRHFKGTCGVEAEDVAKRLMDYGFHAPTLSFPIANTLMIEPTESESKEELDKLCDALINIREEIKEIEEGKVDKEMNLLKGAPHTCDLVTGNNWDRPYTRERAAYPAKWLREHKHWPAVARIDGVFGDRHLQVTRSESF